MKRLFLVSLTILLLVSCQSVKVVEEDNKESSLYYSSILDDKESKDDRYNYIYYLYKEGNLELVLTETEKAAEKYPEYSRFLKLRALTFKDLGDGENYSSTLYSIILLEPYDEELRDLYLDSLTALGKKEQAESFSKETITFFPENKKAISILAETSSFYSYLDSLNKKNEENTLEAEELLTSGDITEEEVTNIDENESTTTQ